MTRIGITQRVEVVEEYGERRDCLDQQWGRLIRSFGFTPIPLFNDIDDVEEYLTDLDLKGVILTGGNDLATLDDGSNVAPERDTFEQKLLTFALDEELPVFGVCRGAQFLNMQFGGSLSRIEGHVATSHDISITDSLTDIDRNTITVNSYHNYGIDAGNLAENFEIVGQTPDGSIEWIEHDTHPIAAIMWHPERDSPSEELDRRIISQHFANIE